MAQSSKRVQSSTGRASKSVRIKPEQLERKIAKIDQETTRTWWHNPLILAIAAGTFTLGGNIVASVINGINSSRVEEQKIQGQLLIESIKTADSIQAVCNLDLLVQAGIFDPQRFPAMANYVGERNEDCIGIGPKLPASSESSEEVQPAPTCNKAQLPAKALLDKALAESKVAKTDAWLAIALKEVGTCESTIEGDVRVGEYWRSIGQNLSGKDHAMHWNAAFMSWVLQQAEVLSGGSMSGFWFETWGQPVGYPRAGAITIALRGRAEKGKPGPRYVGFYLGEDSAGNILVLGGNVGNQVSVHSILKSQVVGYRMPLTWDGMKK